MKRKFLKCLTWLLLIIEGGDFLMLLISAFLIELGITTRQKLELLMMCSVFVGLILVLPTYLLGRYSFIDEE